MNIELWKKIKKEKKLTLQDISRLSGIPKRTVDDIFAGKTPTPRANTVQAIEKALGLYNTKTELSEEENNILNFFRSLTSEEKKVLIGVAELIISKRK